MIIWEASTGAESASAPSTTLATFEQETFKITLTQLRLINSFPRRSGWSLSAALLIASSGATSIHVNARDLPASTAWFACKFLGLCNSLCLRLRCIIHEERIEWQTFREQEVSDVVPSDGQMIQLDRLSSFDGKLDCL